MGSLKTTFHYLFFCWLHIFLTFSIHWHMHSIICQTKYQAATAVHKSVSRQYHDIWNVNNQAVTLVMSTPVSPSTVFGNLSITSSTSPVNLDAPTSPLPIDTIFTAFVCASGAAISAATWRQPAAYQHSAAKSSEGTPTWQNLCITPIGLSAIHR